MTTPLEPRRPIVLRIRHRALRKIVAVKFLWRYLVKEVGIQELQLIKVLQTAEELGLKPGTTRKALRLLVQHRYLDCVVKPTGGTPGEYIAGPRAYALPPASVPRPRTRLARRGPPPPASQLPLDIP